MQSPPNDMSIEEIIVLSSMLRLDNDKYFNPSVISIKPNINL